MAKRNKETTEYFPEWDTGTYQTGAAKPQTEHRGLIALLMILVIFLGGIASLLGWVNIRLLQQLSNAEASDQVPMYEDDQQNIAIRDTDDLAAPSLPNANDWVLPLETIPQDAAPSGEILAQNQDSLVSVHISQPDSPAVACGVLMDEAGYLITNAYPISDTSHIFVRLADDRSYRATVVGTDEYTDLAVLFIDAPDLVAAQFAITDDLLPGDPIVHISAQMELMEGRISLRSTCYTVGNEEFSLIQTDLSEISGPLFNAYGQIVGFGSPFISDNGSGTAIPSALVKDVAQQIIQTGKISGRPTLGAEMEEVQPLHQQYWQLPQGLRVTQANAQLQGLEPGDILISLDGLPITNRESLRAILRNHRAGDQVTATVVRDHQTITLILTVHSSGN